LLSAAPLAGAESVFPVLTAAGPVHEVRRPDSLVDLLRMVALQQLVQIGDFVVGHCDPPPSESVLAPQMLQSLMDWICPTFGMTDAEEDWLGPLSLSTSFLSLSSI